MNAFDWYYLWDIVRQNFVSKSKTSPKLQNPKFQSLVQMMNINRLCWLGHVLNVVTEQLPRDTLSSEKGSGWKLVRGGRSRIWPKDLKS